jgi:serine/threonine protein kinase
MAQDRELGRQVAVKRYREFRDAVAAAALARFEREAKILARHPHPAVVPIYDVDLQHSPPYVVLRWMEGGDLAGRIKGGGFDLTEVVAIGVRLAEALAHLHERGILHRDVKPENVLLDEAGEVYLADLGLADALEETGLTKTGLMVGTPRYMAPELFEQDTYSTSSDVYALALVLLEVTLGERLALIPAQDLPRLQEALKAVEDPELRRLLRACLRTAPEERSASAAGLAEALRALEPPPSVGAPVGSVGEETRSVAVPVPPAPQGHSGPRSTASPGPAPATSAAPSSKSGRRPLVLGGIGALLLGLALLAWASHVPTPVPAPVPVAAASEPAAVQDLVAALESLEDMKQRMEARLSRFRREHHTSATDSSEMFLADAPALTEASLGSLWARYLRTLADFLDAVRRLPPDVAREHRVDRTYGTLGVGPARNLYGDVRRLELRAASLTLQGRASPLQLGEYVRRSKDRVKEMLEITRAWPPPDSPPGLAEDPGVLIARSNLVDVQEEVGIDTNFEELLDAAAAHPEHPLERHLFAAAQELLLQEGRLPGRGMPSLDCARLVSLHRRYEGLRGTSFRETLLPVRNLLQAHWRCPEDPDLRRWTRARIDQVVARVEKNPKVLGYEGEVMCREVAERRKDLGVPEPARELTVALEAAAACP